MPRITKRVPSAWPVDRTFEFMADLRNFEQWDPGVKRATLSAGSEPGAESSYEVTVGGIGRDIVLTYETIEYEHPRRVVVRAANAVLVSFGEIEVEPDPADGSGCTVVYTAALDFHGALRLLNPTLGPIFSRIVNRAANGLREVLASPRDD